MPYVPLAGAQLYYEDFGRGPALLLLHGMLESGRRLAQLALRLSSAYRVLLPDLRGYGRSSPPARTFPPDFYQRDAADMAALLDHLGVPAVRILGTGDGAEVALLLALARPALVRAVVAVDVAGALPAALLEQLPALGGWVDAPAPNQLADREAAIRLYGLEGVRAQWAGWKQAVQAIIAAGGNISLAQAGAIRCPVLILNGAADPLNTPALSQALAAALPQATLQLLPDTAQLVYDQGLRTFHPLIVDWFQAH